MTQPHVALDAKALAAARKRVERMIHAKGFYGHKVTISSPPHQNVNSAVTAETLAAEIASAYLASLPQQTAGPVAWRFKADDPHYDDAYVYCATEEMALLRCPKNSKVEPLYAALEPRASDRGAVLIDLETLKWWRELVDLNPADLAPRLDDRIAAAIRKLSEVSHEH